MGDHPYPQTRTWSDCEAEVKRLRQEKADILAAKEIVFAPPAIPESFVIQELQKANVALHADIARLRSGVRCPHCDELRLDLGEARGEIERLREADVLMVAQFESQEREITKLVRLLRECIDWVEFKEDPGLSARQIESEAMLVRRVREALGE